MTRGSILASSGLVVLMSSGAAGVHAFNAVTKVATVVAQPTAEMVVKFTVGIPHTCWSPPDTVHEFTYKIGGGGGSTNLTGNEKLIYVTL